MKSTSLFLAVIHCTENCLVIKESTVLDVLRDLNEHLINDTSCTDVGVTYLRVAHLSIRQTYIKSAGTDDSIGALSNIFVNVGLLCGSDCVAVCIGIVAEAVHDNKCYGFF